MGIRATAASSQRRCQRSPISWSGLDIGLDRGTTVSDYDGTGRHLGPFIFTGTMHKVTVDLANDQSIDHDSAGRAEVARE
jgi:hypothetical protein